MRAGVIQPQAPTLGQAGAIPHGFVMETLGGR
jgi:hypothetical protein